jgi:fibro-slime domain-containing protein
VADDPADGLPRPWVSRIASEKLPRDWKDNVRRWPVVHGFPLCGVSGIRGFKLGMTAMRTSDLSSPRLGSVLIFGWLLSACSASAPNHTDGDITGGTGSGSTGGGASGGTGAVIGTGGTGNVIGQGGNGGTGVAPPGCGDGELTSDEACDDGNLVDGDGCAANCLTVDRGFSCAIPGMPCREIARCGDGIVAASERCDDGNLDPGDGCSERCKIELGKKCEGAPSVCTDAVCGNGELEGAESCDDGNDAPFDGCSSLCLNEPNCEGESCTSECGDGLLINEECDDGNALDGDGCSSACTKEPGFTCNETALCEKVNGECVLRVPAVFRDFSDKEPDFGQPVYPDMTCGIPEDDPIVPGIAEDRLDAEGRPVLGTAPANACIQSPTSFAEWFRDTDKSVKVVGTITLFDNQMGGYVNRFGANGEQLTRTVAPPMGMGMEQQVPGATSMATCADGCAQRVRSSLQCDNVCRPQHDMVRSQGDVLRQRQDQLTQLEEQLAARQAEANPDANAIAMLEMQIADLTTEIADLTAEVDALTTAAAACDTDCQTNFDGQVNECVTDCKPCSFDPSQWCTGGMEVTYDGTPLFFPVDSVMGPTRDAGYAQLPLQYGYVGWPSEDTVFPGAVEHNFSFTSEVQYWFRYEEDTDARLDFTGDDDVWVYVNGILAVDLGGIHVPMSGSVTLNAQTAADFELTPGNVYKIVVFQAERKRYGSSFRLTLSGFESTPSDCSAVCGDGILSFGEECDDGLNDGGYGECDAGCKLGPFCGDGVVQMPQEHCDYGPGGNMACPGCRMLEPVK